MSYHNARQAGKRLACGALSAAMLIAALPGGLRAKAADAGAPVFQSARNYGGAGTDAFHDVAYTLDGGFVAMGYSFAASSDPEWTHTGSGNNNDAVLVKFDRDHKVQWSKAYGDTGIDVFNSMDILKDGRIAVVGRSPFTTSDKVISGVSWYVLLIDPNDPDKVTEYRIGGSGGDQGYGIAATSDGGFVVAGWSASKAGYLTSSTDGNTYTDLVQLWEAQDGADEAIPNRIAASGSDSVVVKIGANGAVQYTALHNYGVSEQANNISTPSERLEDMTVDANDNIYLVGYDAVAKNAQNAVIAKLNAADGSLAWHRSAGRAAMTVVPEDAAEYIKAAYDGVAVLSDGSVVATGSSTNDATTEEGWLVTAAKDTVVTHYAADGMLIGAESFGTIDDSDSRPEGVTATPDGGYIVYGSQSGVMVEDSAIAKGYSWGNYGAQDAVLVKYNADDSIAWAENFGTKNGDWINGVTVREDGEIIAVGESNGKDGYPAWKNNGGIDGIVMCSNLYPAAYTEPVNSTADGTVVWADGQYTATGDGYGGTGSVSVTTTIAEGKISNVTGSSDKDTPAYYNLASSSLHQAIVDQQSADIDGVSGATMSSNGILEAAQKTLAQAAAAYVDGLITAIDSAEDRKAATQAAADAYAELGALSAAALQNLDALKAAADANGITLNSREEATSLKETLPELAGELTHNDTYYKLQNIYYQNLNAEAFAQNGLTGEGVKIAVIDSGVTPAHQDLDYSRILEGYDYDEGRVMDASNRIDNNGHGTAVTGIFAAVADNGLGIAGLFPQVQVVPLRLTPSTSQEKAEASSKTVAQAIMDAVDKYQVDVITTSLDVVETDELAQAVAYAASHNVLITGAAGNSSKPENNGADPYIYPASYDEVISVGAVDSKNKVRSNSQKNDKVFVAAPGEDIALLDLTRSARCKTSSGTSYASPMVAAMAVAAKQYDKNITVDQFKTLLQKTSMDAGEEGYDTSYGYGVVDYAAFVDTLLNEYQVTLDQTEVTLAPGQEAELKAEVQNIWKDAATGVIWTTSDPAVATVDENGKVTAVGIGTAVITATSKDDNGQTQTCTIIVKVSAIGISMSKAKLSLAAGKTATLTAVVAPKDTTNKDVVWKTSNKKVAKVNANGKITAVAPGTATITATSVDNKALTAHCQVTVTAVKLTKAKVSGIKNMTYTGKALTQKVTVKLGKVTLKNKNDYTISYKNNKAVGTATVTIKGKGIYTGSVKQTFKITPKGTSISKVTAAKKGFTAKWKKQAKQTTGYEVQYSTSSKFKSGNKSVTVKKNRTISITVKKLKSKKKYYVRIRTYKTVKGKKVFSAWSKAKPVTTKK